MAYKIVKRLSQIINDKLIINASFIFGNTIANSIFGFLFWTIAARFFPDEEVGIASSVISISSFFQIVGMLGLGIGLFRFLPNDEEPEELINSVIPIPIIAGLVTGCIYLLVLPKVSPSLDTQFSGLTPKLIFIALLILRIILTVFDGFFIALRKANYSFYQLMILNTSRLLFIFILIKYGAWGIVSSLLLGHVLAIGISSQIYLPHILPGFRYRLMIKWEKIKDMLKFSFENYIANIFWQMPTNLTAPLALEILGESSGAHVYIVWIIATFISGPGAALGRSALVESAHSPKEYKNKLLKAGYSALGVTIPIAVLIYIFTPLVLRIFGAGYDDSASEFLRLMVIASPFVVGNMVWLSYLRIKKFTKELILSALLMALISIGIPLVLMPLMGINSIGIGWISSQIFMLLFLLITYFWKKRNSKNTVQEQI